MALKIENTFIRLTIAGGPTGNERISWDANLYVTPDSNGINPAAEEIRLSLQCFVPDPAAPGGGVFKECYGKRLPAGSLASGDGGLTYKITPLGQQQGIDTLTLTKTASGFALELVDKQASLASLDYHSVCVALTIGDDPGVGSSTLQPVGNIWNGM